MDASKSHRDMLVAAKRQQAGDLAHAAAAAALVQRAVDALIRANSKPGSVSSPAVLDKIATVHEVDREIDRQLAQDLAVEFQRFSETKDKLARAVKAASRALAVAQSTSYVDHLQLRAEQIDQNLRILEQTAREIDGEAGQ